MAGVAVAASAAGTVATISAQKQQVNAQQEASLQSALDAEERSKMALDRYQQVKLAAKLQRDRELALVSSQRQAANLQVEQSILQNRLTQLQTQLQQSSIQAEGKSQQLTSRNQAQQTKMQAQTEGFQMEQAAQNNLLGRGNEQITALGAQAQAGLQGANQMSQARSNFGKVEELGQQQIANQGLTSAELSAQQYALGQAQDVVGQTNTNNQQVSGMAAFNTNIANQNYKLANAQLQLARKYGATNQSIADQYANLISRMGDSQQYMSNLGSQSLGINQRTEDQVTAMSAATQRGVNDIQTRRNRKAIQAAYQSSLATGNMGALNQVLQEKQNIANSLAQYNMARAQNPGGLSYLSAIAGGVSSAAQLGLFRGGGGGGQQNNNLINTMPPPSGNPNGIVNPPSIQWGQPLNGNSQINTYPPIQWGQPLYGQ